MSKYPYVPESLSSMCVLIETLKPRPGNPRINEDSVVELVELIKANQFRDPIEIDGNNVIVVGDARLKSAKILKMTHVPVVKHVFKSDNEAMAYCVSNNSLKAQGKFDFAALKTLAAAPEMKPFNLGFDFKAPPEKKEPDENHVKLWFIVDDTRLADTLIMKYGLSKKELKIEEIVPALIRYFGKKEGKKNEIDGKKAIEALLDWGKKVEKAPSAAPKKAEKPGKK